MWALTQNEMAHEEECAGSSEDQTYETSMKTYYSNISIRNLEKMSLMRVEDKSVVEATQREKVKSVSKNRVEETFCDVFATGYCSTTDGTKNFFFLFSENATTEMFYP